MLPTVNYRSGLHSCLSLPPTPLLPLHSHRRTPTCTSQLVSRRGKPQEGCTHHKCCNTGSHSCSIGITLQRREQTFVLLLCYVQSEVSSPKSVDQPTFLTKCYAIVSSNCKYKNFAGPQSTCGISLPQRFIWSSRTSSITGSV